LLPQAEDAEWLRSEQPTTRSLQISGTTPACLHTAQTLSDRDVIEVLQSACNKSTSALAQLVSSAKQRPLLLSSA